MVEKFILGLLISYVVEEPVEDFREIKQSCVLDFEV